MKKSQKKLWIGLIVLAFLTPLGIILPEKLKAGGAWGEWGPEELGKILGFVPTEVKRLAGIWKAPVAGYSFAEHGSSIALKSISYLLSGLIGIVIAGIAIWLISRFVKNGK